MTNKNVKIVYYVDVDDNTKGCLCAVPSDKDLRDSAIISQIAEYIANHFTHRPLMVEHSLDMAMAIAHYEFADMYEYEFGVEEVPLLEC